MGTAIITSADDRAERKQRIAYASQLHQDRIDSAVYAYQHQWINAAEYVKRIRKADADFIDGIDLIYRGK